MPIRPVASGGDGAARTLPSYRGDWLPCLMRAPIAPAPDVLRHRGAHRKRAPAVKRKRKAKR